MVVPATRPATLASSPGRISVVRSAPSTSMSGTRGYLERRVSMAASRLTFSWALAAAFMSPSRCTAKSSAVLRRASQTLARCHPNSLFRGPTSAPTGAANTGSPKAATIWAWRIQPRSPWFWAALGSVDISAATLAKASPAWIRFRAACASASVLHSRCDTWRSSPWARKAALT